MKRFRYICLCAALCVCAAAGLYAQFDKPHRFFELGADVGAGVSNGWFRASDIFTETIVIDFTEMSQKLRKGLPLDMNVNAAAFMNLNVGPQKGIHIGLSAGVDGVVSASVPQLLFDLIGSGNALNETVSSDIDVSAELYAHATADVGFSVEKLKLSIGSSFFVPIVYATSRGSSLSVRSDENGSFAVEGELNMDVRTLAPLNDLSNMAWMQDMLSVGGIDFSIAAQYPVLPFLDVGASIRHIPAVAGKLNYRSHVPVTVALEGSVQDMLLDGAMPDFENAVNMPDLDGIPSELETFGVRRPLKIGINAAVRPLFGWRWFTVSGGVDFCFRLNGEEGLDMFFVDYDLALDLKGSIGSHELAALRLASSRENEIFCQSVGFMFNFRVLELNVAVASQSADFLRSFQLAGLGVKTSVKLGF